MKSALYTLAACEALLAPARRRLAHAGVTVFMYHDLGADADHEDAWQIVRRSQFRAQVAYLRSAYELVSLDQALAITRGQRPRPARPAAVLTFDDGLRGNHTHLLPLVRELAVPVTIYVATQHIESRRGYWFDRIVNALQRGFHGSIDLSRWSLGRFEIGGPWGAARWSGVQRLLAAVKLQDQAVCDAVAGHVEALAGPPADHEALLAPMTVEMLAELAEEPLITLGSHTHGHELLPQVDLALARVSIQHARERLARWIGHAGAGAGAVRHFAYPAGRNCQATRALVAELGFATAMGTQWGVWQAGSDPMHIPRVSVGRYDSAAAFKVNALGGPCRVLWPGHGRAA